MAGVVAAIAAAQLTAERGQGIFYRVSGGKNTMYLLGSIHVGNREMYPMAEAIVDAINKADTLVFECDTTSTEAQAATARMMQSEVPVQQVISASVYERLEKAAQKLGYHMASFEKLKPWAITTTLTMAAAAEEMDVSGSKAASALGVENMVRKLLKEQEVLYLETAEQQLGLMEAFSPELQTYLLESACDAVLEPEKRSGTDQDVELWPAWWREGNAQAFADSYLIGLEKERSPELAEEYHQALVVQRNRQMVGKLIEMLESDQKKSYTVVVGLMHLVLPQDSIVTMLRDMGYQVEQMIH